MTRQSHAETDERLVSMHAGGSGGTWNAHHEFSQAEIGQALTIIVSGAGVVNAFAAGPIIQSGTSSLVAPLLGDISPASGEIGLFGTSEGTVTYDSVGSGTA